MARSTAALKLVSVTARQNDVKTAGEKAPASLVGMREFAWMAGVFDMKGRLRRYVTAGRATPLYKIQVETSNVPVARQFGTYTGTRVQVEQSKNFSISIARRNCKDHCPEPHQHTQSKMPTIGRWDMTGVGGVIVLDNLMPYFIGDIEDKREWLAEALSYIPRPDPSRRGWAAVARSINRLYGLGWRIPEELVPQ